MKRIVVVLFFLGFFFVGGRAQDLFEQAQGGGNSRIELNGYIRGVEWVGDGKGSAGWEQKALFSEGALKLKAGFGKMGDAYLDVRVRAGLPASFEGNGLDLREAYVNLYLGPVDLRVGQQIDVWGRADSYNPTDNITPLNALFHSPEPDDLRLGNFLIRARAHFTQSLSLEGVWIPVYRPSVLPVSDDMAPNVVIHPTQLPAFSLKNSGYGFRMNFNKPAGGISLSWFDGYEPYPGLLITGFSLGEDNTPLVELAGKPFHEQVAGLGFETALRSFGLRGEVAWRNTTSYGSSYYIAYPGMRYVAGIDRTFGNLTLILQYVGQYVFHYEAPVLPGDPQATPDEQMGYFNRMMFRQLNRTSHMLSLRPSYSLLHDDLQLEMYTEYNFTTKEYFLYPKVQWRASDMIRVTAGGNIFHGKTNSLYDLVRPLMNGVFLEMRVTF
jgi:hypothetical protein